jgi:tRNA A37 methylthiotransferase MiaB
MITFTELCDKLKQMEETMLIELLELHSDEIVDRCTDLIEDKYEFLIDDYLPEEYGE